MRVLHHLDDATVLRYASGDLDEAFSVVVAAHLAMCDECRRAVHTAEDIGGQLLDAEETAELSIGAFERLMQRLNGTENKLTAGEPSFRNALGSSKTAVPRRCPCTQTTVENSRRLGRWFRTTRSLPGC